jgi:hypothetical protein
MEDFNQTLRNGMITHTGPDVVIWYDMEMLRRRGHLSYSLLTFPDLFKTAGWTDLFLDLQPLFLADPRFNRGDYVRGVLDAGLIGDRKLFVPLMYHLPILITTEEALAYFGLEIDLNEQFDFTQLMRVIQQFIDENNENPEVFLFPLPDRGLRYIYPWVGEQILDYYTETVNIHSDTFRQAMYFYKMIYEATTKRYSCPLVPVGSVGIRGCGCMLARYISNRNLLFNFTMGYRTFGHGYAFLLPSPPEGTLINFQLEGRWLYESPVWLPFGGVDGLPMAQPVMYAAIPRATSNKYNAYEFLRILMSEQWQFVGMHSSMYGMDVYPVNKQALRRTVNGMRSNNETFGLNEQWGWQLPDQIQEEWLEFVWSAVADENFTHTSLRIVYEYMLPFFRGEQTFEEAFSLLENKLTIYVGE